MKISNGLINIKNLYLRCFVKRWQKDSISDQLKSESINIESVFTHSLPYKGDITDITFIFQSSLGIEDVNQMRERSSLGLFEPYS